MIVSGRHPSLRLSLAGLLTLTLFGIGYTLHLHWGRLFSGVWRRKSPCIAIW